MGESLEEFAQALRTYMHGHMDHWWPADPGAGDGRRRKVGLNVTALGEVARIPRNRLSSILAGRTAPEAFQLTALLQVAGADERERKDWEARRSALEMEPFGAPTDHHEDDSEVDGLFMVNTWGASAPLTPEHALVRQEGEVDTDSLSPTLRASWDALHGRVPAGSVCVVSKVGEPDWHEAPDQVDYRVEVRRAPYSLALAQKDLLADPESFRRAAALLEHYDLDSFVTEFPGCKVAVNAQVATSDGYLVALRRSRLVHNYKAQWALSINETMMAAEDPREQEGLFDLAYRGLAEELHVQREEVASMRLEWFGVCLDCGDFYAFTNVRTTLDRGALPGLRAQAHSRREHDSMAFLSAADVAAIDFRGPGPDGKTRWLHHAPLAARLGSEMLR